MSQEVPLRVEVELAVWAIPGPDMDLDGLIDRMAELGNPVLSVDREGNRILIAYEKE